MTESYSKRYIKKCEEFTLCGGVGDADGLFTHGYPDNYAIYHIIIKGNVRMARPFETEYVSLDADGNNLAEVSSISGDNYSGDLLGVFDPSGGLRGVVHTTAPPFGTYAGQAQFLCLIGGVAGDNGSAFTLKLYDASSDSVIDIDQTVTFSVNDIQGSAPAPIVLTGSAGAADGGGTDGGSDDSS